MCAPGWRAAELLRLQKQRVTALSPPSAAAVTIPNVTEIKSNMSLGLTLSRNAGTGGFLVSVPSSHPVLTPSFPGACGQPSPPSWEADLGSLAARAFCPVPLCGRPPGSFLWMGRLLKVLSTTIGQNVPEGGADKPVLCPGLGARSL